MQWRYEPRPGIRCVCTCAQAYLQETIMKYMDHKNLDEDVPFFKDKVRY